MNSASGSRLPGIISAAAAGTLFALAGHVGLILTYGTVLPYRDQWQCTAADVLGPWSDGRLTPGNFLTPLNDHWPVLTRLLSYGLARGNGQWNNLVETSINALIFAAAVFIFLRLVLPGLQSWARGGFTVLAGAALSLPITWENTLWGIQSLVYLQILLSMCYLGAVCLERERFCSRWWAGHLAGIAVLFTQHSAILAHVAAGALLSWRLWRRDGPRSIAAAGLGYALAVIALFAAFFPSITTTAALRADSWQLALEVTLRQLAFPLPHPAWAFLVYSPWLIWTLDRLAARKMAPVDAFIFVVGLWVGGQAAAIGYGRAIETFTFVSRYCDFLLLGWLLNAACVARLWLAYPKVVVRIALGAFLIIWLLVPLKSFWWETIESHAGYNLLHRDGQNQRNLERLQRWFANHDDQILLSDPGTQQELFTYAPTVLDLLAKPRFQALLPPETGSPLARHDHGRIGWLPALLLPSGPWLAGAGLLLLGLSLLQTWPGRTAPADPIFLPGLSLPLLTFASSLFLIVGSAAWLAWPSPLLFDRTARLHVAYSPAAGGVSFPELEFQRYDGDIHNVVTSRAAVDTLPIASRIFWYGTRLATKSDFHGVLRSQRVRITRRYLVVPFTGFPCFPGNGLRLQFVDPTSQRETWLSYVGPDARTDFGFWTADAQQHQGEDVSIFMFDGLDGTKGWLGVGKPFQTNDEIFPARWRARIRAERAEPTHRTVVGLTLATAVCTAVLGMAARMQRSRLRSGVDSTS